jgi:hypothetical protein
MWGRMNNNNVKEELMKRLLTRLPLPLILGLTGLLLWGGLTRGLDWDGDAAAYIRQAISIVEGQPEKFIEENRFTIEQSSAPMGPIAYPWGLPAMLAPIFALLGLNIIALKGCNVIFFLLFLGLIWFGFRKYHHGIWRIFFVCLFALHPYLHKFIAITILSDIVFLFLSTLSVILIGLVIVQRRRLISPIYDHLLLGGVIALAFFVRTNGILILVTLAISQSIVALQSAFARLSLHIRWSVRFRDVLSHAKLIGGREISIALLPYAGFFIMTLGWIAFLPQGGSSHVAFLSNVTLGSIKHHLHYYFNLPADFFIDVPYYYIVFGASIPLALLGMYRRYRSDYHMIVYIALTVLLYVVWPVSIGLRCLFPILPFYLSFVIGSLEGNKGSAIRAEGAIWKTISILPVIVVLFFFGKQSVAQTLDNLSRNREIESRSGPFDKTSKEVFSFITTHTPSKSTIVFFKPRFVPLFTDRRSIRIFNVEQLSRGDYLCYYRPVDGSHQISRSDIENLLKEGNISLVYVNDDYEVYRLNKSHNGKKYQRITSGSRV